MRTVDFFARVLCVFSSFLTVAAAAETSFVCASSQAVDAPRVAKRASQRPQPQPPQGQVNVLVVYAQFADEAVLHSDRVPNFGPDLFDPHLPGSFAHFYHTMSFGQLQVQGTVLPRYYTAAGPARTYQAADESQVGGFAEFARQILPQVDADVDLGLFDNDGPDGKPNSGDDDGIVDYLFIILRSTPDRFIRRGATGIAGLGEGPDYIAADTDAVGNFINISNSRYRATLLRGETFSQTVGSMAHEFGHALGLPDLYDTAYLKEPDQDPAVDGAGIGKWGLMGWGARGWNGDDGPNPFCAWSLEQLGWVGRDNQNLIEVTDDADQLVISPLQREGLVCKIPLRTVFVAPYVNYVQEYLLLEQRTRSDHFYNRNLPGEGLLIWHVRPQAAYLEVGKEVDLVSADGLYADAGYPQGLAPDTNGGDNLDFWAHAAYYAQAHAGNKGDATDLFDGRHFTRFDMDFLPGQLLEDLNYSTAATGLIIDRIHRRGQAMVVDIRQPRWAGTITGTVHWMDSVIVDGDITVAPEGKLIIFNNVRVQIAGSDRLQSGIDPARCEFRVQGQLRLYTKPFRDLAAKDSGVDTQKNIIFQALHLGATWQGIFPSVAAQIKMPEDNVIIEDALCGLVPPGTNCVLPNFESEHPTAVVDYSLPTPETTLLPNYPNPFNPQTTIRYSLSRSAQVELTIYNALGQQMRTLAAGIHPAGAQAVVWDGRDQDGRSASSGLYFCRLEVEGQYADTRQMLLVR